MFDADTLESHNEFIEIYNLGVEAVTLNGFLIGDDKETDKITDTGEGLSLSPQQFGIILDKSYFGNSYIYDSIIPEEALILTIDDASFGQLGLSNSIEEKVVLMDYEGDTIQCYQYSLDNQPGFSDEKILLNQDNSASNWHNSIRWRGTPGYINSVTPLALDGTIDSVWIEPVTPLEAESFSLKTIIRNIGQKSIDRFSITLFEDLNGNSELETDEIIYWKEVIRILVNNDTMIFHYKLDGRVVGYYNFGISLTIDGDLCISNNVKYLQVYIEPDKIPVVINEIMFKPKNDSKEWLELYNYGELSYNLKGWRFADSKDTVVITHLNIEILPEEFILLCKDSTSMLNVDNFIVINKFPILNNDFDDLKLISPSGRLIERVPYDKSWMGKNTEPGISLERIHPEISSFIAQNWGASLDIWGSTPGQRNSIFFEESNVEILFHIHPNPFSPDDDGYEDTALIDFRLPFARCQMTIDIYDISGRHMIRLSDHQPVTQKGQFVWDGMTKYGRKGRMGIYVILFRMNDPSLDFSREIKKTIVITKR